MGQLQGQLIGSNDKGELPAIAGNSPPLLAELRPSKLEPNHVFSFCFHVDRLCDERGMKPPQNGFSQVS